MSLITVPVKAHLFTAHEAATKLSMSEKTLMRHVREGRLRFINIATGMKRKRYRFTQKNLDTFTQNQKEKLGGSKWPSTSMVRSTGMNSRSTVVAFSALPKPKTKKTPLP